MRQKKLEPEAHFEPPDKKNKTVRTGPLKSTWTLEIDDLIDALFLSTLITQNFENLLENEYEETLLTILFLVISSKKNLILLNELNYNNENNFPLFLMTTENIERFGYIYSGESNQKDLLVWFLTNS